MNTFTIVMLIILVILIAATVALYFLGKKAEKRQAEQEEMIASMAQNVTMLIIDKKKMKMKQAGFPDAVMKEAPRRMKWMKIPVVKAKVGPRVMTFMCDGEVFELIPVGKEVKATISGIYISKVRGIRGPLEQPKKKKKGFGIIDKLIGK